MMYNPYKKENLYIAGPECFYNRGYSLWYSQRQLAEYYGFNVVLPTSTQYKLDNEDLRLNADEIFTDLIAQVEKTTTIIADLEFFRGCEPDSGTVFEIGWIYAQGGKCYGYTKDLRPMVFKNHNAKVVNNRVVDEYGWTHPYSALPFCPSLCASTKIIEGSYENCLKSFIEDITEEKRVNYLYGESNKKSTIKSSKKETDQKTVYISSPYRYKDGAASYFAKIKEKYEVFGYKAVSSLDGGEKSNNEDPLFDAVVNFKNRMALIDSSDYIVANLNGFHGLETNNDVSFECGYAYAKGKKLIGLLDDNRVMRDKIPSLANNGFDIYDNTIENFNYPINLMFACTMDILQKNELEHIDEIIKKLES